MLIQEPLAALLITAKMSQDYRLELLPFVSTSQGKLHFLKCKQQYR